MIFFKNLCERNNISHEDKEIKISKEDFRYQINKEENKKIKDILYQKGYDLSFDASNNSGDGSGLDTDLQELTNIINSGYHYKPSKLFFQI